MGLQAKGSDRMKDNQTGKERKVFWWNRRNYGLVRLYGRLGM
jgi:hypothetical protein